MTNWHKLITISSLLTIFSLGGYSLIAKVPALSQSSEEVSQMAKEITVKIEGCGQASGVIYEREGNTYSVLTAYHILVRQDLTCLILTPDEEAHRADAPMIQPIPGVDLGILRFTSNKSYTVGELGDSDEAVEGKTIYVAGAPQGSEAIPNRTVIIGNGTIVGRTTQPRDGYALIYDALTRPGMSGGPVLDNRALIIGIHGRGDRDQRDEKTGLNLGIPIQTFLSSRTTLSSDYKELIDRVWLILDKKYVNGTFNQVDWKAVRTEYLDRTYTSDEQTYDAIREMLELLDDPYTRFMDPEEYKNLQIDNPENITTNNIIDFLIVKDRTEIHPVKASLQESVLGNVGYIRLNQFSANAVKEMQEAIQDLEQQNVSGYILDLRSNPGGLLNASVEIARMWLWEGDIVSTVNRIGVTDIQKANRRALTSKPLVVLVNEGSASASEILSAALQDNNRAILVGTNTYGGGLVQLVQSVGYGAGLAVTIAKIYTPNGRGINNEGIVPDVVITLSEEQRETLRDTRYVGTIADPQYAKAMEVLIQEIAAHQAQKSESR